MVEQGWILVARVLGGVTNTTLTAPVGIKVAVEISAVTAAVVRSW